MHLYRRMLLQTCIYTWGNNDHGSLSQDGRSHAYANFTIRAGQTPRVRYVGLRSAAWPQHVNFPIGITSDLQCGGWSTVALNSKGYVYISGAIDGADGRQDILTCVRLPFPEIETTHGEDGQEGLDRMIVSQMSVGRRHILALSDSREIWCWTHAEKNATRILLPHGDAAQNIEQKRVTKVVAGWDRSSAYIKGIGIVVWDVMENSMSQYETSENARNSWVVPDSQHRALPTSRHKGSAAFLSDTHANEETDWKRATVGEVTNWIVLSNYLIFVTHLGRVFAVHLTFDDARGPSTFELTRPAERTTITKEATLGPERFVIDVQGAHETFALLLRSGQVLTAGSSYLDSRHTYHANRLSQFSTDPALPLPLLQKIPSLQHTGVIQLAFGDWHFHALHARGYITSHGKEPQFCGALGLGNFGIDAMRGIKSEGFGRDGRLLDQCETTGRSVHFEDEMRAWMDHIRNGGNDRTEALERMDMFYADDGIRTQVSEWVEDRLKRWEKDAPLRKGEENEPVLAGDDGLPSYFALSVAAAGWHSGALVLVNPTKSEDVRMRYRHCHPWAMDSDEEETEQAHLKGRRDPTAPSLIERMSAQAAALSRWFLGLPPAGSKRPKEGNGLDLQRWSWEDETFPRLRLRDGTVLPGRVAVKEWDFPESKGFEGLEL